MAEQQYVRSFFRALNSFFNTRTDYSGRGMYGDTCVSINLSSDETRLGDVLQAILDIGIDLGTVDEPMEEDAKLANAYDEFLLSAQMDGMGTGTVIYFPKADTTGWEHGPFEEVGKWDDEADEWGEE